MNVTMRVLHLAGYPSNDVEASPNRSGLVLIRALEPLRSRRQKFDRFIGACDREISRFRRNRPMHLRQLT